MIEVLYMWGDLPVESKKKLNILAFVYLPFLLVVALFLGVWIANLVQLHVDIIGFILVLICFVPLYFICLKAAYKKVKENSK
jgi:hypothetical protein